MTESVDFPPITGIRVWRYVRPDGKPDRIGRNRKEWEWQVGAPGPQALGEDPKQIGVATIVPGKIQKYVPWPDDDD